MKFGDFKNSKLKLLIEKWALSLIDYKTVKKQRLNQGNNERKVISEVYAFFVLHAVYCLAH